ncbi:tetratricopeptide repeat protein [Paramicrobacterium fandaimingii]|uniref:tetratricopeptide repeat protein n=1 Tax=Paramicrobacterium fandaimingii TaxID=2708079 RepID=UPI001421DC26|nr:tetratricopeptide repeat protein [Microbacterium fandaimingii]
MTNSRPRRTRTRLVLITLPLVLIALTFSGKLVSLGVFADQGSRSYAEEQYTTSASQFDGLMLWNAFEPWIAPFDRGTAHAAAGDFPAATEDLSHALVLAPDGRTCEIRVNLALAWEQQGDAHAEAGSTEGATRMWETALAVIEGGASEGCDKPQDSKADEQLKTAKKRIEDKLNQESQDDGDEKNDGSGTDDSETDGEESDGDSPIDDLNERGKDAERKKQDGDADRRGSGGGGGTDKPW